MCTLIPIYIYLLADAYIKNRIISMRKKKGEWEREKRIKMDWIHFYPKAVAISTATITWTTWRNVKQSTSSSRKGERGTDWNEIRQDKKFNILIKNKFMKSTFYSKVKAKREREREKADCNVLLLYYCPLNIAICDIEVIVVYIFVCAVCMKQKQ